MVSAAREGGQGPTGDESPPPCGWFEKNFTRTRQDRSVNPKDRRRLIPSRGVEHPVSSRVPAKWVTVRSSSRGPYRTVADVGADHRAFADLAVYGAISIPQNENVSPCRATQGRGRSTSSGNSPAGPWCDR